MVILFLERNKNLDDIIIIFAGLGLFAHIDANETSPSSLLPSQ